MMKRDTSKLAWNIALQIMGESVRLMNRLFDGADAKKKEGHFYFGQLTAAVRMLRKGDIPIKYRQDVVQRLRALATECKDSQAKMSIAEVLTRINPAPKTRSLIGFIRQGGDLQTEIGHAIIAKADHTVMERTMRDPLARQALQTVGDRIAPGRIKNKIQKALRTLG